MNRRVSSTWLWWAAGAAFVLAVVGAVTQWYLDAYWPGRHALLTVATVVKWVCPVAATALTISAILVMSGAAARRLFR
jgi:hypothetical protein